MKDTTILINLYEASNTIGFSITNNCNTINLTDFSKVFEKYESYAHNDKRCSTGLGLYISKKIIEAHEGEISIERNLDDKTITLNFFLPKHYPQ